MKKLLFVPVIVVPLVAGYFFSAQSVQAWTLQDCIAVNYNHPDCNQYVSSPTPVASPTATPKGDGPTGPSINQSRIDSPAASRGEGIGGSP